MTPSDIEEAARRRYNSVGDSFWSQDEIFQLIYDACLELALETKCIERTFTSTSVSGTQEYAYPTNVIGIKRVTYDNKKLKPINFREDDAITGLNQAVSTTGSPSYYFFWDYVMSFRPIPDDAKTIKVWAYVQPSVITSTSTLEVPTEFHMKLVNYVLGTMAAKDTNWDAADRYMQMWTKTKVDVLKWVAMRKRLDSFANVIDEEQSVGSYLGLV